MVLPSRGHLDTINRMMTGDYFIGRGSRQRSLKKSIFCNAHKVSAVGRDRAIELFNTNLSNDLNLLAQLWTLSGLRLVCHCAPSQACDGEMIIQKFAELYPDAFDRSQSSTTSGASILDYLAALREEPPSDPGSSPDEGALPAGSGWTGSTRHALSVTVSPWHRRGAGRWFHPSSGVLLVRTARWSF